jgi:hypothetical protein
MQQGLEGTQEDDEKALFLAPKRKRATRNPKRGAEAPKRQRAAPQRGDVDVDVDEEDHETDLEDPQPVPEKSVRRSSSNIVSDREARVSTLARCLEVVLCEGGAVLLPARLFIGAVLGLANDNPVMEECPAVLKLEEITPLVRCHDGVVYVERREAMNFLKALANVKSPKGLRWLVHLDVTKRLWHETVFSIVDQAETETEAKAATSRAQPPTTWVSYPTPQALGRPIPAGLSGVPQAPAAAVARRPRPSVSTAKQSKRPSRTPSTPNTADTQQGAQRAPPWGLQLTATPAETPPPPQPTAFPAAEQSMVPSPSSLPSTFPIAKAQRRPAAIDNRSARGSDTRL